MLAGGRIAEMEQAGEGEELESRMKHARLPLLGKRTYAEPANRGIIRKSVFYRKVNSISINAREFNSRAKFYRVCIDLAAARGRKISIPIKTCAIRMG